MTAFRPKLCALAMATLLSGISTSLLADTLSAPVDRGFDKTLNAAYDTLRLFTQPDHKNLMSILLSVNYQDGEKFSPWQTVSWTPKTGTDRLTATLQGTDQFYDRLEGREIIMQNMTIDHTDLDTGNVQLRFQSASSPLSLTFKDGSIAGQLPPTLYVPVPFNVDVSGDSQIKDWTGSFASVSHINIHSGSTLKIKQSGIPRSVSFNEHMYFGRLGNTLDVDGGSLLIDSSYLEFGHNPTREPSGNSRISVLNGGLLKVTGESGTKVETDLISIEGGRLELKSDTYASAKTRLTLNNANVTTEDGSTLESPLIDVFGSSTINSTLGKSTTVETEFLALNKGAKLILQGRGGLQAKSIQLWGTPDTELSVNDEATLLLKGDSVLSEDRSSLITTRDDTKKTRGEITVSGGFQFGLTGEGLKNNGATSVRDNGKFYVLGKRTLGGDNGGSLEIADAGLLDMSTKSSENGGNSLTTANTFGFAAFSTFQTSINPAKRQNDTIVLTAGLPIISQLADLKLIVTDDAVLSAGTSFVLIDYSGNTAPAKNNYFSGYPDGTTFNLGQNQYKINYYGADPANASAVTLTVVGGSNGQNGVPTPGTNPLPPLQPAAPKTAPVIGSTVPGDGSVGVFWTPPVDNGGTAVTGYKVQVRQGTTGPWIDATGGCAATSISLTNSPLGCTITGLTNGTPYYVQVAAVNAQGQGGYSAPGLQTPQAAQAPTPTPIPKPTPMTIIANPDVYATAFNVSLVAPTNRSSGLLGNDVNCLSVRINTQPSHGTVTLNPNGGFEYKPQTGYVGTDSFTYVGQNGSVESSPATVSIQVGNANALPPVANPDAFATPQDVALNLPSAGAMNAGVLANDGDPQGYSLTATVKGWPTHGNLTLEPHGGFSYTPVAGYVGRDSFSYSVSNGVSSSEATVLLTVESNSTTNQPPLGNPDAYATLKDVALSVPWPGVLGNDYDPEGVALTATIQTQAKNGNVAVGPYGRLNYVPNAGFVGKDSFTYVPSDGVQSGNPVTVTVTVNNPSTSKKPVANPDAWSLPKDSILFVREPKGVLANDLDPSGNQLAAVLVTQPQHGLLAPLEGGGFIYTPEAGYTGSDSFTYLVTDGLQSSDPTTVSLKVNASNRPPVAKELVFPVSEDESLVIPPSKGILSKAVDPDGHLLTTVILNAPVHGVVVPEADGGMAYIPAPGFSGIDTLRFSVTDGRLESNQASVTFKVNKASKKVKDPKATVDRYGIPVGGVLDVPQPGLLRNDRDPQKDPLLVYLQQVPEHGSLHLGMEGDFRYYPDPNYEGRDSFTYRVYDGLRSSRPARVWLNVKASQKTPKARAHLFRQKPKDLVLSIPAPGLLKFAKDPGHFFLTPYIVEYPSQGLLRLDPNGSFVYYPEPGCSGSATFKWKASNDVADSNVATGTLKCAPGH